MRPLSRHGPSRAAKIGTNALISNFFSRILFFYIL
jgi:hypothetical protein